MSPEEHAQIRKGAPVVVVALIKSDRAAAPETRSRFVTFVHIQLHGLNVLVENVLKGTAANGHQTIFYYHWDDVNAGNTPLGKWSPGDRYIFYLRRDRGVLRTAADFWRGTSTIRVLSGKHTNYNPLQGTNLDEAIAKILFAQGQGITNQKFASSLASAVGEVPGEYSYPYLTSLSKSSPDREIRVAACQTLQMVSQPCS